LIRTGSKREGGPARKDVSKVSKNFQKIEKMFRHNGAATMSQMPMDQMKY
jgi:hypothetical protein